VRWKKSCWKETASRAGLEKVQKNNYYKKEPAEDLALKDVKRTGLQRRRRKRKERVV
jgi:hypothetical protein